MPAPCRALGAADHRADRPSRETHFYIAFSTTPSRRGNGRGAAAQHPDSITIVLQHQFADLAVTDTEFTVTLFFGGKPSTMTVPFDAVTSFNDLVGFGLQFGAGDDIEDDVEDDIETDIEGNEAPASESAEVVSLDSFRKSPS